MLPTDDYLKILETCPIRGHDDAILRALRYIDLDYPVMLYGPPGNGKTTIAAHLLTYLGGSKDSFYEIEGTEGMSEYQIIGGFHPLSMSGNSELAGRFVYKHGVVAVRSSKGRISSSTSSHAPRVPHIQVSFCCCRLERCRSNTRRRPSKNQTAGY